MKNVKDIVIGIFALIGFFAIASGFSNNQAQEATQTSPESHVWEVQCSGGESGRCFQYNKITGEIRVLGSTLRQAGYVTLSEY